MTMNNGKKKSWEMTFEEALPQSKFFDAELRLHDDDAPSSVTLYLWDQPQGSIVLMDVVLDFDVAWQMINECFDAGLKVVPVTSSVVEFFVVQHYAGLNASERTQFMWEMRQLMHPTAVTNGS